MKKKNLSIIILLVLLIGVGFRFSYKYIKQAKKQEQIKQVEIYNKINAADINKNKSQEAINGIMDTLNKQAQAKESVNYDKFIPIDNTLSLCMKDNNYYVVDAKAKTSKLLKDVTNAYVLYIKDEDNDDELNGLFVQKNNNWYLLDELTGEVLADLKNVDLSENSQFVIKNNVVSLLK